MRARAEAIPTPDRASQSAPPVAAPHPAPHGLIVEDGAAHLAPGQMTKSKFLALLRQEVCRTAEAALSATGRTAKDCPYLDYWFNYYSAREAGLMERSLLRYAPDAAGAVSAEHYIPAAVERVRKGIAKWVGTGEIDAPKEALQMADAAAPPPKGENVRVQLKATGGGARLPTDPHRVRGELRSGNPLPGDVRTRMETAFGHDFSRVRIHTDEPAARLSTSLNAHAFTIGSDIAFAPGAFRPGLAGDALLAHELAHVVQQEGAPSSASAAPYAMLEADADHSALSVLAALWGGAKAKLGEMAQNALPRMRSGLSLQRCGCDTKDYPVPTAPIAEVAPPLDCSTPQTVPWDDIRKHAGNPGVLGFTQPRTVIDFKFEGSVGNKCKLVWNRPAALSLEYYEVPPPGTYATNVQGTPPPPPKRCKGKTATEETVLSPDFVERIKAGEREHCEDHKFAYAKTSSRAVQALEEMTSEFCAGGERNCGKEGLRRFERRLGYSFERYQSIIKCLFDRSHLVRDEKPNEWHSASAEPPVYSADCGTLTYQYDPKKALKEVGKHASQDVIKGCGE